MSCSWLSTKHFVIKWANPISFVSSPFIDSSMHIAHVRVQDMHTMHGIHVIHDCHLAHIQIYLFILLGFLVTSIVRPTDRTTEPDSESIRNSEIPKFWFVQKVMSSSSPSQCIQALQPWISTWIVQLKYPCALHTLKCSNEFWICLYNLGSWLVLPMWDISYFWFSFLPKLPTHITLHPISDFRIYDFRNPNLHLVVILIFFLLGSLARFCPFHVIFTPLPKIFTTPKGHWKDIPTREYILELV